MAARRPDTSGGALRTARAGLDVRQHRNIHRGYPGGPVHVCVPGMSFRQYFEWGAVGPGPGKHGRVGRCVIQRGRDIVVRYAAIPSWGIASGRGIGCADAARCPGWDGRSPSHPSVSWSSSGGLVPTVHTSSWSSDRMSRSRPHDVDEGWSGSCTLPGCRGCGAPCSPGASLRSATGYPLQTLRTREISSRLRPPRPSHSDFCLLHSDFCLLHSAF